MNPTSRPLKPIYVTRKRIGIGLVRDKWVTAQNLSRQVLFLYYHGRDTLNTIDAQCESPKDVHLYGFKSSGMWDDDGITVRRYWHKDTA
jgi:hypothetical protein